MAWMRTGLSLVGAAAVVARLAVLDGSWAALGIAVVGLAAGALVVLPHGLAMRRAGAATGAALPAAVGAVACTGLATAVLAVSAAVR